MHKLLRTVIVGCLIGFLVWYFDRDLLHFLGWDGQTSDNYAAWSGSLPALFTLAGMSTIVTGLFHNINCHEPGCWRVGRHKVDGSPWCNVHHENARPAVTDSERLDRIIALLEQMPPAVTAHGEAPPEAGVLLCGTATPPGGAGVAPQGKEETR